jgi:hypothetical protein
MATLAGGGGPNETTGKNVKSSSNIICLQPDVFVRRAQSIHVILSLLNYIQKKIHLQTFV